MPTEEKVSMKERAYTYSQYMREFHPNDVLAAQDEYASPSEIGRRLADEALETVRRELARISSSPTEKKENS